MQTTLPPTLPHNIDLNQLLGALTDPAAPAIQDIAADLDVTVTQLLDAAEHPLVTSIMSRMNRLDRRRAKRLAAARCAPAIDTLDAITVDPSANPETRRKAAAKLITITWKPSQRAAPRKAKARVSQPLSPTPGMRLRESQDFLPIMTTDLARVPEQPTFPHRFPAIEPQSQTPIARPAYAPPPAQHHHKRAPPDAEEEKEGQKETRDQRPQRE